jgi:hypothetical protein
MWHHPIGREETGYNPYPLCTGSTRRESINADSDISIHLRRRRSHQLRVSEISSIKSRRLCPVTRLAVLGWPPPVSWENRDGSHLLVENRPTTLRTTNVGRGLAGGTVAHVLTTTTHWLAPKWGGQSPLLSLSNNTNTNQPTNHPRKTREEGPQEERCRSRWSIPESRNRVVASVLLLTLGNHHFSCHPVLDLFVYLETAGRCLDGLNASAVKINPIAMQCTQ